MMWGVRLPDNGMDMNAWPDKNLTKTAWAYCLPAALLILLQYVVWISAWVKIGHCPLPYLDDPKFTGGFVSDLSGIVFYLALIMSPLFMQFLMGSLTLSLIGIKRHI